MNALKNVPYFSCGLLQDQNNTLMLQHLFLINLNWPVFIDLIAVVSFVKDHGVACHFRRRTNYCHFLKLHPEKHGSIKNINNEKNNRNVQRWYHGSEHFPSLKHTFFFIQHEVHICIFHVLFCGFWRLKTKMNQSILHQIFVMHTSSQTSKRTHFKTATCAYIFDSFQNVANMNWKATFHCN